MIQVRVRQDDRINPRRIDGQRLPVPPTELLEPLKQAAIDQNPPAADLEQVLRPGDRARSPEKAQ
jgi:hypothetical protein